jgi:hypothetical protein
MVQASEHPDTQNATVVLRRTKHGLLLTESLMRARTVVEADEVGDPRSRTAASGALQVRRPLSTTWRTTLG